MYHFILDEPKKLGCIAARVLRLLRAHDSAPQCGSFIVLTLLSLVPVVALLTNDVVTNGVWSFSSVRPYLYAKLLGVRILLIVSMIGVQAHLAIGIER